MRRALEADGEGPAGLAGMDHVEGNGLAAFDQVSRIAQRNDIGHARHSSGEQAAPAQPLCNNHAASSGTEWATNNGPSSANAPGSWAP